MVILVGDPNQLQSVVQSSNSIRCGYGQSLFEVIIFFIYKFINSFMFNDFLYFL